MQLPKKITLVEVGPRDGLQNEKTFVPTENKIEFINRLSQTGLRTIEIGSFVSAKKIPQLADTDQVLHGIQHNTHINYPVLVPNLHGYEAALTAGATTVSIFGSASESFSQRNINCSMAESLERFTAVLQAAKADNIPVRGYISCCLGCPYEGEISLDVVADYAAQLYQMGCHEICLADTIGIGTPGKSQQMIKKVSAVIPLEKLAVHFHDTYGQALANIFAILQCGITTIDSAVAGLGGCPYAKGATGNVSSEDVLYMLNGLDIDCGVDLTKLIAAGEYINTILQRETQSRVAKALKL